jgi:hypothetical protein
MFRYGRRARSIEACFRTLGLPESASTARVTARFRRLAKQYHPDRNRSPSAHRRFIEIADAYAVLRDHLRIRPGASRYGRCPDCGRYADLFDGLDGGRGCADCLLGRTRLSRFLPLPDIQVARHVTVLVLYAAGMIHFGFFLRTDDRSFAAASLLCLLAGLLVLATEVLAIAWRERARTPRVRTGQQ